MFGTIFLQVIIAILILFGLTFLYCWLKDNAPDMIKTLLVILSTIIIATLLLTYAICEALETKQSKITSGEEYSIKELLGDEM